MLVARSPPPPLGVSVAKHRAPVLQTCGLGRASSDTGKNFRFEVQTCSWKTVIGASCPPAPHSYRCHVILTEPRGSANQIIKHFRQKIKLTALKNLSHVSRSRDFFSLASLIFFCVCVCVCVCVCRWFHCQFSFIPWKRGRDISRRQSTCVQTAKAWAKPEPR